MKNNNQQSTIPLSSLGVDEATGEDYVVALSDRNWERLEACFQREARMRALVPSGFQEARGTKEVVARLNSWFSDAESIQVLEKSVYKVADRLHISYRFRTFYSDGERDIIQQEVFCELQNGAIVAMNLLCSGFRPEKQSEKQEDEKGHVEHFDAGDLGCSSGLPEEFRKRIEAIPVGNILEVVTRDPAAKEDLPSMSRLLGHKVLSIDKTQDGNTVLLVQRGR